jgi:hypothetical protein
MASIDGTLREPTPTGVLADRADCYRIAVVLLRESGMLAQATPEDVLFLAQWLTPSTEG